MIYYEVVHQVVVLASNFHNLLYQMNLAILWRLRLGAWALCLGSWRLGACSLEPLIRIRGPCLAHPLLMIFKSSAMVESCGPDA